MGETLNYVLRDPNDAADEIELLRYENKRLADKLNQLGADWKLGNCPRCHGGGHEPDMAFSEPCSQCKATGRSY